MRLAIAVLLMGMCACGQTKATRKLPLPANACKTEPNGDKVWYPESSEFSPPGYADDYRVRFDGWPYKCANGKWITNEEAVTAEIKHREPLDSLIGAARSRLLTIEETKKLLDYGPTIFVHNGEAYQQADIDRKFDNLLFLQKRFMLEASVNEKRQ